MNETAVLQGETYIRRKLFSCILCSLMKKHMSYLGQHNKFVSPTLNKKNMGLSRSLPL